MRDNLATESRALQQERGRQERLATSINDQMHAEAQVGITINSLNVQTPKKCCNYSEI